MRPNEDARSKVAVRIFYRRSSDHAVPSAIALADAIKHESVM